MSVTLDATVGGSNANAYLTSIAAQAILDGVPNASAFTGGESDDDDVSLVYATTMLGALAYLGSKSTAAQALPWPRIGVPDPDYGSGDQIPGVMQTGGYGVYLSSSAIPTRLLRATAMLALEIRRAGTSDVWGVDDTLDVTEETVDVITTKYARQYERRTGLRRYPSVWREIFPLTLASQPREVVRG